MCRSVLARHGWNSCSGATPAIRMGRKESYPCTHCSPDGTNWPTVGRRGSMKPSGRRAGERQSIIIGNTSHAETMVIENIQCELSQTGSGSIAVALSSGSRRNHRIGRDRTSSNCLLNSKVRAAETLTSRTRSAVSSCTCRAASSGSTRGGDHTSVLAVNSTFEGTRDAEKCAPGAVWICSSGFAFV